MRSLLDAFEHSQFSFVITDAEPGPRGQRFLFVNDSFKQQTGYTEAELHGRTPRILQGPATDTDVIARLRTALEREEPFLGQTVNYRKDGSSYLVRWSINPLRDEGGRVIAYISNQMEVSQQVRDREQALFLAEALNQSAEAVLITDLNAEILYSNPAFSHLTGYPRDQLIGSNARMFKAGQMSEAFYDEMRNTLLNNETFEGIFLNQHRHGHYFFQREMITPVLDSEGHPRFYVATSNDSSEQVRKSRDLEYRAYRDPLTGLFNRARFDEVIALNLRQWQEQGRLFSLIFADIDHFKPLNDTLGHDVGDAILKQVAETLSAAVRDSDVVVRWGGEEFCIILDAPAAVALRVADTVRARIAEIVPADYQGRHLSMSFGVTEATHGDDSETIVGRADQALYTAKNAGRNRVVCLPDN